MMQMAAKGELEGLGFCKREPDEVIREWQRWEGGAAKMNGIHGRLISVSRNMWKV